MKATKTIPIILILILSISMVSALELTQNTDIDCAGKLTYADKVLAISNDDENGNFVVGVQGSVGYPEDNLHLVNNNCESLGSGTFAISGSFNGMTLNPNNLHTYIRQNAGGNIVTIYEYDENFNQVDSWTPIDNSQAGAIQYMEIGNDEYIYIIEASGNFQYYSMNGIYLGTTNITEEYSCGGQVKGMSRITEDTLIIQCALGGGLTSVFTELTNDFQNIISETPIINHDFNIRLMSRINDLKLGFMSETTLIRNYNVSDTLIGSFLENYSTTYCVNHITLCEDTIHHLQPDGSVDSYCNGVFTECPLEATSGGCQTEIVNDVLTGSCGEVSCESQCDFNNKRSCTSINTYTICGNYDADVCLETGASLYCPNGQSCSEGDCVSTNLTSNLLAYKNVVAEVDSTNGYDITQNGDIFYMKSTFENAQLGFKIFGTPTQASFSAHSNAYQEITIEKDDFTLGLNGWTNPNPIETDGNGNKYIIVNDTTDEPIKTFEVFTHNKRMYLELEPTQTSSNNRINLHLRDNQNNTIGEVFIRYTTTDKMLRVYDGYPINSNIFEESGLGSDLERLVVEVEFNEQINTYSFHFTTIRNVNGEEIPAHYYSVPFGYDNINALAFNSLEIDTIGTENSYRIQEVSLYQLPDFPNYNGVDVNGNLVENSLYETTGCFETRFYANDYAIPTYHFYTDKVICVNKIGDLTNADLVEEQESVDDEISFWEKTFNGGEPFGQNAKTLFAIIVVSVVVGFFTFVYSETKDKWLLGVGALIGGLLTFYFAQIGFIPIWIVVIIGIVAIGIVVQVGKNTFVR